MTHKPLHLISAAALVGVIVATTALLRAPGFVLLAVPTAVGLGLSRKHPRVGAAVIALGSALVLAIAIPQLAGGPQWWIDGAFDVAGGIPALIAFASSLTVALGRTGHPVSSLGTASGR